MKLEGFVNGAYTLDSVDVDAQRCVNLYPEAIESGTGKGGNPGYLKPTPGLSPIATVGDGPLRMIHKDANNRIFVASGNELYRYAADSEKDFDLWGDSWETFNYLTSSDGRLDLATDKFNRSGGIDATYFWTGQKVTFTTTAGPAPNYNPTTPLVQGGEYYLIIVDTTHWRLASTLENALNNVYFDFYSVGAVGQTYTFTPTITPQRLTIKHENVNFSTNEITIPGGHTFSSGDRVYLGSIGCELPSGLEYFYDGDSAFTYFFARVISSTVIQLCSTIQNVVDEIPVDLVATTSNVWPVSYYSFIDPAGTVNVTLSIDAAVTFETSTGRIGASSSNPGTVKHTALTMMCDGTAPLVFDGGIETFYHKDATTFFSYNWGYRVQKDGLSLPAGDIDIAFSEATHVDWIDGYFILTKTDTALFYTSGLNDLTVDPLSFAQAEGSADRIIGLIANVRNLWVFGERSTEVYVNTGNPDFPFERIQSGFMETGCVAEYSIGKIDGVIFWLGRSDDGEGVVYMATSTQPQRVSTHAIEQAISGYADISSATSYTYQSNGHKFYVLNFTEATWVYDMSTGLWHERAYTNAGVFERHRGDTYCFDQGAQQQLIGDYSTNNLYKFDDYVYEDNSNTITRLRTLPHFSNENFLLFWQELWLDMHSGIGLASGQGSDPQVMLDWSDDGGHTWSNESWASAGAIGEYSKRVRWRRLGKSRDRIFRFKITDPVKTVLIAAYAKIKQGFS